MLKKIEPRAQGHGCDTSTRQPASTGARLLYPVIAVLMMASVFTLWRTMKDSVASPEESERRFSSTSGRGSDEKKPLQRVRQAITWAGSQTELDQVWFRQQLRECSLDDIRALITNDSDRPGGLRDAGWLSKIDCHPACTAYLLIFERYAELDFAEAMGFAVTGRLMNLDEGLRSALLRGGGRSDAKAVIQWLQQSENLRLDPDGSVIDETYVGWFRAVMEGWEESHPGEAIDWISQQDGPMSEMLRLACIDAGLEKATWSEIVGKLPSLKSTSHADAMDGKRLQATATAVATRWIAVDAPAALAWVQTLPEAHRELVWDQSLSAWWKVSPADAVRFLEESRLPLRMSDEDFVKSIWTRSSSADSIVESAAAIRDPALREYVGEHILLRLRRSLPVMQEMGRRSEFSDQLREHARAREKEMYHEMQEAVIPGK